VISPWFVWRVTEGLCDIVIKKRIGLKLREDNENVIIAREKDSSKKQREKY